MRDLQVKRLTEMGNGAAAGSPSGGDASLRPRRGSLDLERLTSKHRPSAEKLKQVRGSHGSLTCIFRNQLLRPGAARERQTLAKRGETEAGQLVAFTSRCACAVLYAKTAQTYI